MRLAPAFAIAAVLLLIGSRAAVSQSVSVSGNPAAGTLTITGVAAAGLQPTSVTNAATTYRVTAPATAQHITGKLNLAMPANTTLSVLLGVPAGAVGATSNGTVILGTLAQNLVGNIKSVNNAVGGITYTFAATVAAGVIASTTRTVTFTIVTGP